MQETTSPSIVINISGGNNQILPVATHAEQHYHYHTAGTGGAVSHCTHFRISCYRVTARFGNQETTDFHPYF